MSLGILKKIIEKGHFPCVVSNKDGEELKSIFTQEGQVENEIKEAKKRYSYDYEGCHYTLLEEFLFDEKDNNLDYKKIIGRNFYLSRKK